MKKLLAMALMATMAFSFSAFAEEAVTEGEDSGSAAVDVAVDPSEVPEGMKIGLTVYSLDNPYFVEVANGAQARCDELGIELIVDDPHSDIGAQVDAIENFITQQCDAIICCALDTAACEGVLQEAQSKGIKIISQSSCNDTRDIWVSADEYNMGWVCGDGAGRWLEEHYGADTDVTALVCGWDVISTQILRGDGMRDGILEHCPNVKIVRQDADKTAEGNSVANSVLQANPDLQAVVCINDAAAIGVYAAVQAAGKDNDDFYIGAIDNTAEGRNAIAEGGCYRATVDLIPFDNGGIDVDIAVRLVNGETLEDPYVIPARLVTQEEVMAEAE